MPGLMNQALLPQGGTYQLKIISPSERGAYNLQSTSTIPSKKGLGLVHKTVHAKSPDPRVTYCKIKP